MKEVKSLTRTKDIIDVLSRNYAANKSLISKIISPIINLPDPTSYNKSMENCKEILAFLKRMKDNDYTTTCKKYIWLNLKAVHFILLESRLIPLNWQHLQQEIYRHVEVMKIKAFLNL